MPILFNNQEDLPLMDSFLQLYKEHDVDIPLTTKPEFKEEKTKKSDTLKSEELHGIISLPDDFDNKDF